MTALELECVHTSVATATPTTTTMRRAIAAHSFVRRRLSADRGLVISSTCAMSAKVRLLAASRSGFEWYDATSSSASPWSGLVPALAPEVPAGDRVRWSAIV